jgi:hypothetical protein
VTLGRGGAASIRVEEAGRRPVAGAVATFETADGTPVDDRSFVTGPDGRVLADGLPPGTLRMRVRARGLGRSRLVPVKVDEGAVTPVLVVLRDAGSLRLVVTGDGPDVTTRARVDVLRAGTGEPVETRRALARLRLAPPFGFVPRTGILEFRELEEGDYVVHVTAGPAYVEVDAAVRVRAGQLTSAAVHLPLVSQER